MRNIKKILVLLVVVSLAIGCLSFINSQQQPGIAASVKRGNTVYMTYCLPCHQADGAGVPNLNPPLIKTKYVLGDKKELITIVLKGLTGEIEVNGETFNNVMPSHIFLTDQQVADVLTYVRNSFTNKATPVTVAEVKAVRAKVK